MSDAGSGIQPPVAVPDEPLTIADLNAFFAEKISGGLSCPLCRTRNFNVYDQNPTTFANLYLANSFWESIPPLLTGTSIRAIPIFCTNCGFTAMFNRALIIHWKRNRK
jgi:predicted nucleic-acid-binding Zn-ribbon protein